MSITVVKILDAQTTTGAGAVHHSGARYRPSRTFTAALAGSGAISATVLIEISLDEVTWDTLVTFDLSGTDSDGAGAAAEAGWLFYRANVTAISGTGAAVTVHMGL